MDPRALLAVICALLGAILDSILGPHLFALLAVAAAATVAIGFGYCIARVAAETGMRVIPVARATPT